MTADKIESSSSLQHRCHRNVRIVWAIIAKDMVDALKNRTTLTVLLSVLFVIVLYQFLPSLESEEGLTNILVYDAGDSSLVPTLHESLLLNVYTGYSSTARMKQYLANGNVPELGLSVPPDFDQALAAGEELTLEGYVVHWVSPAQAEQLAALVEDELFDRLGRAVDIHIAGEKVYPTVDSSGYPFLTSLTLIYVTTMIGLTLVPHLMIEEKKNKTIDALLISPASPSQIVMGKALTGLFYCLIGVGIVLVLNHDLVTNWSLALVATICGSALGVAWGLLLGSAFDHPQQLMLWAWVLIVPLLIPVFLSIMDDLVPESVLAVIYWIPTVALGRAFRLSFSASAPLEQLGPDLVLLACCTALVGALAIWVVRKRERQ